MMNDIVSNNNDIISIISMITYCNNSYSNSSNSNSSNSNSNSNSSNSSSSSNLNTITIKTINDVIPLVKELRNSIRSNDDKNIACYLQQENIIKYIANICKIIAINKFTTINIDSNNNNDDDSNNNDINACSIVVLYLCQFIANFTACSDDQKKFLWSKENGSSSSYIIEYVRDMLAATVNTKSRKALAAITASIYNSICYNDCDLKETICSIEARGLCCQLMLAVIDCKCNNDVDDPLIEWLLFITLKLARQYCLSHFFELLGATDKSITMNHEQVVFLQILRDLFEDKACLDDILSNNYSHVQNDIDIDSDITIMLKRLTSKISIIGLNINTNMSIEEKVALEALPLIMNIIGTTLAAIPKSNIGDHIRSQLSIQEEGYLLHFCFEVISSRKYVDGKFRWEDGCILNSIYGIGEDIGWDDDHKEMIKLSLEIIGNLAYGCQIAQDKIHELGGIPLLLSCCATDFENPLAREWALMSVRNCCEGNIKNQEYIDSLKVQGVVQGMNGVNIDINTTTGKFQFQKES